MRTLAKTRTVDFGYPKSRDAPAWVVPGSGRTRAAERMAAPQYYSAANVAACQALNIALAYGRGHVAMVWLCISNAAAYTCTLAAPSIHAYAYVLHGTVPEKLALESYVRIPIQAILIKYLELLDA